MKRVLPLRIGAFPFRSRPERLPQCFLVLPGETKKGESRGILELVWQSAFEGDQASFHTQKTDETRELGCAYI